MFGPWIIWGQENENIKIYKNKFKVDKLFLFIIFYLF